MVWFMVTDWLHAVLQPSTFIHKHDSNISGYKLFAAWLSAKNVLLFVHVQMNVGVVMSVFVTVDIWETCPSPATGFSSQFWFVYVSFTVAPVGVYDFLLPQQLQF